ncbi:MAG: hypothetical protein IJ220_01005 [Clostridia bacterium]|nr:hypothetical protein [Clostridia bacterium]
MKNSFLVGLATGIVISSASLAFANSQIQVMLNDRLKVELDGVVQEFRDETTNEIQYPITYHDRTYLPLRTVADLMNVDVDYDEKNNTAILRTQEYIENTQSNREEKKDTKMKNDLDLIKYMTKSENYMVSPFSLRMAMMLAANGAEGKTKSEILDTFGIQNIEEYNQLSQELIKKYQGNKNVTLNVANSIWLNSSIAGENVQFTKEYVDLIAKYYDGTANVENENKISSKANSWIAKKTNGKIKNMLDEKKKADFLALLINTIYFKGAWANEFDEYATFKETFTDRNNSKAEIDFMHKTAKYDYFEDNNMKMIRLPYKGYETSMYVVLPKNEKKMDIENAIQNMSMYKVEVSIPKFKTEYSLSFSKILQQLGVNEAFNQANAKFKNVMFKGVSLNKNVYIGDVLQKTFIEVDEAGTEAAAATAVIMNTTSALPQPEEIKEFKANKPFIYFIMDENTNQVLFMGEQAFIS